MFKHLKSSISLLSKRDRRIVCSFGLIRVLLVGFDMIGIVLVGILVTKGSSLLSGGNKTTTSNTFTKFTENLTLQEIALLVLISFLSKSGFSIFFMRLMANSLSVAEGGIAKSFYGRILRSPMSSLDSFSHAEIVNSVTHAINFATTQMITIFVIILSELSMLIAILILFATINLNLTLIMGFYFLIIGLSIQKVLGNKLQSAGLTYSNSINAASTTVTDSLGAFRELSTMSMQNVFEEKFGKDRYQYAKAMSLVGYYSSLPRYIVESALMVGVIGLTFFSFKNSTSPDAAGALSIFLTGGLRIVASMLPLQNAIGGLKQHIGQGDPFYRINDQIKSTENYVISKQEPSQGQGQPEKLEFHNVSFKYPNSENYAISNLTFQIFPGEQIAIVGPSGSGKSTLADLVIGLTVPTSGSIDRVEKSRLGANYSYVPQSPGIVTGTISENITLSFDSNEVDYELLQKSINLAHLTDLIDSLPEGVNTYLGAQSNALSGGQMQRIGLARALYGEPRLLVLDEATSALDAETESAISENLDQLRGKCTTVVIAHKMTTVQNADRVIVLENGRLLAIGKFADLAKTNSIIARYVELSELSTN